jgi:hypothetical protein
LYILTVRLYIMLIITCKCEQKYFATIFFVFAHFSCLLPDNYTGRVDRKLWWTNQGFSSFDIIVPSWLSVFIYILGDEK